MSKRKVTAIVSDMNGLPLGQIDIDADAPSGNGSGNRFPIDGATLYAATGDDGQPNHFLYLDIRMSEDG